jgi:hypothetical protein
LDPLKIVRITTDSGLLPQKVYNLINDRFHFVTQGISRVEMATGIKYPLYYIEPKLVISTSEVESGQFAILFARTIPVILNGQLTTVVQLTAPLITYALMGTIHAILAHEFLHYLHLMRKMIKMDIISDEVSSSLFEEWYIDHSHMMLEKVVFKRDPYLVRHLLSKFSAGFKDGRLENKVIREWMHKGLPVTKIQLDSNVTKLPIEKIASAKIDPELKEKILGFEI